MASNQASEFRISGETQIVGVFGCPVAHSLSPAMHNAAFAALNLPFAYVAFPVRPEALGPALASLSALGVVGVNLTIPHKESALPFLDEITDAAREVGAVNTVHCQNGRLLGDNTDGYGFYEPLREMGYDMAGRQAVVLGAGGAARAVVAQLIREGARVVIANRSPERAERLAQDMNAIFPGAGVQVIALDDAEALRRALADSTLLTNTTRVGMRPDADALPPIPPDAMHPALLVYDLVYNPAQTRLLELARAQGCPTLTGVKMLVYQGGAAFQRWTGRRPPIAVMEDAVLRGLT